MKKLIAVVLLVFLSGCGVTRYQLTTPDGVNVSVWNTKDYESYELTAKKQPDASWSIRLKENGVSASDPMKGMSDNVSKLINLIPQSGG